METTRLFTGTNEDEIWTQIVQDMAREPDLLEYAAQINQNGHTTVFNIDIDLGGGFEGGYETTTFRALVPGGTALRFAIHEQDWVSELGKLLGLEDVELGYPEFDKAFIVKTNQPERLKVLFADERLRNTLLKHQEFELNLAPEHHEGHADLFLTFTKEAAVVEPADLQEIYHMLYTLLQGISADAAQVI